MGEKGGGSGGLGGGKWGERGRELGMGYPPVHPLVTTEHDSFSCHLQGSDATSIQPGTKGRVCWFCH